MATTYRAATGGVLKNETIFVFTDLASHEWIKYLDWVSAGGVTDPFQEIPLADSKLAGIRSLELEVAAYVESWFPESTSSVQSARFAEALLADADGTPTAGEYPFLAAEVGSTKGVDLPAVIVTVFAERTAFYDEVAEVEGAKVTGVDGVNAATSAAEVTDAVDIARAAIAAIGASKHP